MNTPDQAFLASVPDSEHVELHERIVDALRDVYDPEIPVNIFDLGLIYDIRIRREPAMDDIIVELDMTLTTPGCPVAQTFPGVVEDAVADLDGVKDAYVDIVWEPPWTTDRISDEAKLALGLL